MPIAASARSSAVSSVSGRRLRVLSAAVALGLGLAACGGGTQVSEFKPTKIVSFGDELSFLGEQTVQGQVIKGQKYGVNYLVTDYAYYTGTTYETDPAVITAREAETYGGADTYTVDTDGLRFIRSTASNSDSTHLRQTRTLWGCSIEGRLWTQILASGYGLGYATGCPADKGGAVTHATVGAKTADVIAQLNAHKGELTSTTLATVLAGQNDIIEQLGIYRATPGQLANIKATLKSRGEQLGKAVNGVLSTGARVLIVTPPDLGKAPGAGPDAAALTEMTQAFIDGFTGINGVLNDGNKIGLVKAFDLVKDIHSNPSGYSLNVLERACDMTGRFKADGVTATTSLLDCTYSITTPVKSTLVPGASMYSHLWASDWVLAPGGQARIGSLAYSRATSNPF